MPAAPSPVLRGFLYMAVCFGLNHGTVVSMLQLASSTLGHELGGYSSGTLYVAYTLAALTAAPGVVQRLGAKWALFSGLAVYCAYVLAFVVAVAVPAVKWPVALVGSVVGGVGGGCLWTAQGAYFAASAELYAHEAGVPRAAAANKLAGAFASIYLGAEVGLKLLMSVLMGTFGLSTTAVFFVFMLVAVAGATGAAFVPPVDGGAAPPPAARRSASGDGNAAAAAGTAAGPDEAAAAGGGGAKPPALAAALRLLVTDSRCFLMVPFNAAFGLTSGLLVFYVNAYIITPSLGVASIGYCSAVNVATGSLLSVPIARLTDRVGHGAIITAGGVAFGLFSAVVLVVPNASLGSWGAIVPLLVCFGFGRAVWESTTKAVFAVFFPDDKPAAFANVILQSGAFSSVAFFTFPGAPRAVMALCCLAAAVLAPPAYLAAALVHKQRAGRGGEPGGESLLGRDFEEGRAATGNPLQAEGKGA